MHISLGVPLIGGVVTKEISFWTGASISQIHSEFDNPDVSAERGF